MDKLAVTSYASEENFQRLDRVQQLAEEHSMSIPQIAMAYVMSQPLNIFALVGCQTSAEFKANMAAADLRLSEKDCAWLDLRSDSR
jgi:aryl-alcohol dehydrogenase-like predicted oxidoreductase